MDKRTIEEAWEVCTVEEMDVVDASLIGPAVFEPKVEGELVFNDRLAEETPLWDSVKEMDGISCMTEPLDGFLRTSAYVYNDEGPHKISVRTYPTRIKISPGDTDCSFEAFNKFIQEWEEEVCELEFLGDLDEMPTADED